RRLREAAIYLPGLLIAIFYAIAVEELRFTERLHWNLERLIIVHQTVFFAAAAVALWRTYREADTPLLRQQMKWVTRGTILAITPYPLFYVIPYLRGAEPTALMMKLSMLTLIFLPLTLGYAIVRYRLMDVDLIFKRGMTYTLATAVITGVNLLLIGVVAERVH